MFLRSRRFGSPTAGSGLGHAGSVSCVAYLRAFFFPATVFFGPFRVRALVRVR